MQSGKVRRFRSNELMLSALMLALAARASAQASPPSAATPAAADQAPTPVEAAPPALDAPAIAAPPAGEPPTPPRPAAPEASAAAEPAPAGEEEAGSPRQVITLSGYAEAYYSWNFAKPDNKITNNRWLDEKHNTFTLQTVVLDVAAEKDGAFAKLTLMFGPTADRWYFEGARIPDTETGTYLNPGKYSNETWKNIQQAYAGYRFQAGEGAGLTLQGGLMATQVGFEGAAVKDNWNFSRSNLFNFLPFFHVGVRATYALTKTFSVTAALYNGYNQATDLNDAKSVSLQTSLVTGNVLFNVLYIGGKERGPGDPAGRPWRNLFDAIVQYDVSPVLSLGVNGDAGFERGRLGTDGWLAGALYARVKATPFLYFAARGDGIYEFVPEKAGVDAEGAPITVRSPIFFGGGDHVLSGTVTVELRPIDGISFRLEYRHDDSDRDVPLFYKKGLDASGAQLLSHVQNTFTFGMTGWF